MYFLNIELLLELFKILTNNFLFKLYFYLVKFYLNLLLDKWWIANFKISKMRPLKFAFLKYQIPFPAFALITSLPKLLKWLLVLAQHNYSRGLTSYLGVQSSFPPKPFPFKCCIFFILTIQSPSLLFSAARTLMFVRISLKKITSSFSKIKDLLTRR